MCFVVKSQCLPCETIGNSIDILNTRFRYAVLNFGANPVIKRPSNHLIPIIQQLQSSGRTWKTKEIRELIKEKMNLFILIDCFRIINL